MVQPVSRLGASFCTVSDKGTFQGTMPATTPTGLRSTSARPLSERRTERNG